MPFLLSYFYVRKAPAEQIDWWLAHPGIELLIDSGGFSALNRGETIDLDEYIAWCLKWQHRLFGYFALDRIGDPVVSAEYLKRMHDAGLKPIPIHIRGDDEARMDELFEMGDWVGMGGFRRPQRGWCGKDYVKKKMRWAKGRNVHWLGYTKSTMLTAFRPYSCDSSNPTQGDQYGLLGLYLGNGKWYRNLRYAKGDKSYRYSKAETGWKDHPINNSLRLALAETGFTEAEFRDHRFWRGSIDRRTRPNMLSELNGWSFARYSRDLRAYLGTRYFMAMAPDVGAALHKGLNRTATDPSHTCEVPSWMQR